MLTDVGGKMVMHSSINCPGLINQARETSINAPLLPAIIHLLIYLLQTERERGVPALITMQLLMRVKANMLIII